MNDRKRIEELERRVKELEARPIVYPTIIIHPAVAAPVYPPTLIPWNQPWITWSGSPAAAAAQPSIIYSDGHTLP